MTPPVLPRPRRPLDDASVRQWYEGELGWPTAPGSPGDRVELLTGLRFDALELPAEAGGAVLRRFARSGPAAVGGGRMWLLVAAGAAEELPGLLDWLEWGGVALDLTALGPGGRMPAPWPAASAYGSPASACGPRAHGAYEAYDAEQGLRDPREAADGRTQPVWLRPPELGCEVEPTLPATTVLGGHRGGGDSGCAPDLVRLVGAVATECHRTRLLRATSAQALAFS